MANYRIALVILAVGVVATRQDIANNQIDNDANPLAEAAAAILQEQGAENIGSLVSNLMQSGGAKQLGDLLATAAASPQAGQLLQGLGSLAGQGLDPSMLGSVLGMLQPDNKGPQLDPGAAISMLGSFLSQGQNAQNMLEYIPMMLQTVNSFIGADAQKRAEAHSDHAWFLPPVLEKIHILFDHFMHSELGQRLISVVGAEKFFRIFTDATGRFNYDKFVELLENHSFRRHWIRMVTNRIAAIISYVADPQVQKKYFVTFQHLLNSVLKSQGYPKSALFDPTRPTETITAILNHFARVTFKTNFSSKQYVKPAVEYVQDLLKMAQKSGLVMSSGVDSRALSDKLADTINLEVIEPIARVNRAFRFAKKVPKCDSYVMCLVNKEAQQDGTTLPGLKSLLTKSTSLVFSWFLSSHTGTSFWSLYNAITDDVNCQSRFLEPCNEFHIEEVKVTTEYVHNEL